MTAWPSPPVSTALPLDGATWEAWTVTADGLAERSLAVGLRESRPGEAGPEQDLHRALDLLVLGRAQECVELLRRAGVHPPAHGDDLGPQHLLLAAGHAATGDDGAWSWLLATLAQGSNRRFAHLLVAGAGDARGDTAAADRAWTELVRSPLGTLDRRAAVRAAVVEISARSRSARADDVAELVATWSSVLVGLDRADDVTPSSALAVATGLVARGDRSGARLLLRATAAQTPRSADLRRMLGSLTPRWAVVRTTGAVVVAAVAIAGLLALALRGGRPMSLLFAAGFWLWHRFVPLAGLTQSESRVWRGLGALSYDEVTDAVATPDADRRGWYGVAGIVGAIAGLTLCLTVLPDLAAALGAPGLLEQDGGLAVWLAVSIGLAVAGYCGVRALHLRSRRRTAERRRRAAEDAQLADAARCRCWHEAQLGGLLARHYADGHLVVEPQWSRAVARLGRDAAVARCPQTGSSWLVGPLGADGRWLALRGPAPVAPQVTTESGFYL